MAIHAEPPAGSEDTAVRGRQEFTRQLRLAFEQFFEATGQCFKFAPSKEIGSHHFCAESERVDGPFVDFCFDSDVHWRFVCENPRGTLLDKQSGSYPSDRPFLKILLSAHLWKARVGKSRTKYSARILRGTFVAIAIVLVRIIEFSGTGNTSIRERLATAWSVVSSLQIADLPGIVVGIGFADPILALSLLAALLFYVGRLDLPAFFGLQTSFPIRALLPESLAVAFTAAAAILAGWWYGVLIAIGACIVVWFAIAFQSVVPNLDKWARESRRIAGLGMVDPQSQSVQRPLRSDGQAVAAQASSLSEELQFSGAQTDRIGTTVLLTRYEDIFARYCELKRTASRTFTSVSYRPTRGIQLFAISSRSRIANRRVVDRLRFHYSELPLVAVIFLSTTLLVASSKPWISPVCLTNPDAGSETVYIIHDIPLTVLQNSDRIVKFYIDAQGLSVTDGACPNSNRSTSPRK